MEIASILLVALCCILLLAVVIGVFVIGLYNSLVRLKVLVDEAWSGIDVQLKKRYDLIPNLVNTVKGYASHEKGVFEKVTQLRSAAMSAGSIEEKVDLENQLTGTLKTLFAVAENYPELKADASFLNLQQQLSSIEDELEGARRYYNGTVREFNTKIVTFPNNIIAGILKFTQKPFFEAETEARENVKVDFNN